MDLRLRRLGRKVQESVGRRTSLVQEIGTLPPDAVLRKQYLYANGNRDCGALVPSCLTSRVVREERREPRSAMVQLWIDAHMPGTLTDSYSCCEATHHIRGSEQPGYHDKLPCGSWGRQKS